MFYTLTITRAHSGLNSSDLTMGEAIARLNRYALDFPGEILNVTITKM